MPVVVYKLHWETIRTYLVVNVRWKKNESTAVVFCIVFSDSLFQDYLQMARDSCWNNCVDKRV